jgi:hypothetical protein
VKDARPQTNFCREVSVTIGDEIHHGTYFVQGSMVHVKSSFGAKANQVAGFQPENLRDLNGTRS